VACAASVVADRTGRAKRPAVAARGAEPCHALLAVGARRAGGLGDSVRGAAQARQVAARPGDSLARAHRASARKPAGAGAVAPFVHVTVRFRVPVVAAFGFAQRARAADARIREV
jgi:hypothetical protein